MIARLTSRPNTCGSPAETPTVPVVALGASAGGLEALRQLFAHLPEDTGMAFVVIQHLDPERPSILTRVLEGVTRLSVVEATNDMHLEPNRVHVIPSDSDLTIQHGILMLVRREKSGGLHLPIDSFLRSLAKDCAAGSVGVVLSGSGADGTEGLRAIKAEGGIAIAQEPDSAQFRSMPESAINAGVVDFWGTPEAIAMELVRLGHHFFLAVRRGEDEQPDEKCLDAIFSYVRRATGVDFSGYKRKTVLRRIERRMTLRHVAGLAAYASLLGDDADEVRALAKDLPIHVTSFFRDPEAFSVLEEKVLPELVRRRGETGTIRIWVPGCSSGEEAYSIVMCLLDALEGRADRLSIQVFGTDVDNDVIEAARLGVYADSAVAGISAERLSRFFDRVEGGYRIGTRVRDLCIFVKHDLVRDPPFAKLDLISCRNVLIYFDTELQRRIIPLLHYCLNDNGYLFLGQSEAITGFRDLLAPVDEKNRIFMKTGVSPRLVYPMPASRESEAKLFAGKLVEQRHPVREAQRQADHLLLARYAAPGVVVNDRLEIVQYRGRTGSYLEPPPGQPQTHLLRMVREGLVAHVHEAFERAKAQSALIRKEGLRVPVGTEIRVVNLEVIPLTTTPDATERFFLILFEESGTSNREHTPPPVSVPEPPAELAVEIARLKAELFATRDYLQSLISEHQMTMDDLAATNEEMVAANEELQSTNEELQSAKEELQSTNEELNTVNDQLRNRNHELDQVANDLINVLASVEIPIIIVDLELRVRRFTPALKAIASFIPEDVGRPIEDLKLRVDVNDLASRIRDVIGNAATPRDWDVRSQDGRWLRMQIRPYRTTEHRLDGAVLSFVDVDVLKKAKKDAEGARDYARTIVETVTTALVVVDSDIQMTSVNGAFVEKFAPTREAVEGKSLFELGSGMFAVSGVRRVVEETLTKGTSFTAFEFKTELPEFGPRIFSLTGRPIFWRGSAPMVLLAIEDVTDLRALEAERAQLLASEKQARVEAERATRAKDVFLAVLSHELRTPLSTILMSAELLKQVATIDPKIVRASATIQRAANAQARLIDDLLDVSRIVSGKLLLDLGPVDIEAIIRDAVDVARPSAQAKSLTVELIVDGPVGTVYGDAARLQQVVNNLLNNAIKFTPHGGRVSVRIERRGEHAQLTVTDTGMGIRPEVLPHLFSSFIQADSSVTRTHGGLGLGLAIVRHLVEVHGGNVQAESLGEGEGATFRVTLPLGLGESTGEFAGRRAVVRGIEGVRVLLVEDDDDTRESYAAMLAELGVEVRAVSSAAAGIAVLDEFRPRVILSDIAMPGEDGFSFIRRVRRREPAQGGRVPAAALTALASDQDRQQVLLSGFQLHVTKPVDAARLASVVRMLADWTPLEAVSERVSRG